MRLRNWAGLAVLVVGIALSVYHHSQYAPIVAGATVEELATYIPSAMATAAAAGLLVGGGDRSLSERPFDRAAVWYVVSGVAFGATIYVSLGENLGSVAFARENWFTVANWAIAGSAVGLLVANYDMRRSFALAEARESRRTADRLAQRLSVLNRVLRHDVRNKANVVLGYAEEIERDAEGADLYPELRDAVDSLTTVADRARRVQELIENESPEAVDLSACVADAVGELRDEYPDVEVEVDGATGAVARTYPAIHTVVRECLDNAVVHNPLVDSACRVSATVRNGAGPAGDLVEVVVADNGPGIPDRERVVLSSAAETQLEHSRGTSLWLTRWVAEASGGDVAIETPEDGGTRVRIRLPVAGS